MDLHPTPSDLVLVALDIHAKFTPGQAAPSGRLRAHAKPPEDLVCRPRFPRFFVSPWANVRFMLDKGGGDVSRCNDLICSYKEIETIMDRPGADNLPAEIESVSQGNAAGNKSETFTLRNQHNECYRGCTTRKQSLERSRCRWGCRRIRRTAGAQTEESISNQGLGGLLLNPRGARLIRGKAVRR
jgi:hypothetical protein